jgi:hypothetical protein
MENQNSENNIKIRTEKRNNKGRSMRINVNEVR